MGESFPKQHGDPKKRPASVNAQYDTASKSAAEMPILRLQRTFGNQAVQQMLLSLIRNADSASHLTEPSGSGPEPIQSSISAAPIQAKFVVGRSEDEAEGEADLIADEVMRMPEPQVQRVCACGGGCPKCQRHSGQKNEQQIGDSDESAASDIVRDALDSPGQPLHRQTRQFMEARFGYDFGQVRVHTDRKAAESARMINALAYTSGQNIVFGEGQYAPDTAAGKRLMAHELTHVIQQAGGAARSILQRQPKPEDAKKSGATFWYSVKIKSALDSDQLLLEFIKQFHHLDSNEEAQKFRKEKNWHWIGTPLVATEKDASNGYKLIKVNDLSGTSGGDRSKEEKKERSEYFKKIAPEDQDKINAEADRRFWEKTNHKVGEKLGDSADDQKMAQYWMAIRDELIRQRQEIDTLPPVIKNFLFTKDASKTIEPKDYAAALKIAEKLKGLSETELNDYKSKVTAETTDWNEFGKSVDRYLATHEERQKATEEREKVKTRLFGLVEIYKKYRQYKSMLSTTSVLAGGMTPMGAGTALGSQPTLGKMRAEIEEDLKKYNFATLTDFEEFIRKYEEAFTKETVAVGFDLLAKYEHLLYEEEKKYQDPARAAALYQSVSQSQAQKYYKEAEGHRESALRAAPPAGGGAMLPGVKAYQDKAKASDLQAEGEVSGAAGDNVLVKNKDFDRKRLAFAGQNEVQAMMLEYIKARRKDIEETRKNLKDKPELVFKLNELITASYKAQEIAPGSIFDLIIQDHIHDKSIAEAMIKIAVAVFAIAISLLTMGAAAPVAAAGAVAVLGIGIYQALEEFHEYEVKHAAYGAKLLSEDPSFAWVIVAFIGVGLDMAGAAAAIEAIKAPIETFNAAGDLVKLEKELEALAKVNKINQQIRSTAIKAAQAELEYKAAVKGLLGATGKMYSMIVPDPELIARLVSVAYSLGKRGLIAFEKFLLELKLKGIIKDIEKLTPDELGILKKAFEEGLEKSKTGLMKYEELSEQIRGVYKAQEVEEIAAQGKALGFTDDQIKDFLEMGSIAKPSKQKLPLTPDELKEQMSNWVNVVNKPGGHPYLFKDLPAFQKFKTDLKSLLKKYGVPEGKTYVQGSSLRTAKAKDVDVAIFLSDDEFAKYAAKCRDGIITRNAAKPHVQESLLAQLEEQVKKGYISKLMFDRLPTAPKVSFGSEVYSTIESTMGITTDISVMKSSSKLALYPALEF